MLLYEAGVCPLKSRQDDYAPTEQLSVTETQAPGAVQQCYGG